MPRLRHDTDAAALDAGIQPDDEAVEGGRPSRAALLGGRATSALPRLGPSARDAAPAAFDARCIARLGATRAHHHGLSARKDAPPASALTVPAPAGVIAGAGAQSVGRPGDPGVSGESALARPERLRRIFQTAAVAPAALRRQADMARPPRAAGDLVDDFRRAPTSPGLVPLEVGRWQLEVEARAAARSPFAHGRRAGPDRPADLGARRHAAQPERGRSDSSRRVRSV